MLVREAVAAAASASATWSACRPRAPTVWRWPRNYNGVTRPAVVFVDEGRARLVTRRETYADLLARDV